MDDYEEYALGDLESVYSEELHFRERRFKRQPMMFEAIITKEGREMKLELAIMAGAQSKEFLAELSKIVERLENAVAKLGKGAAKTDVIDAEVVEEDEEEDFGKSAKKSKKGKAAKSFDEEEEESDEQDEEEENEEDGEEESDEEEEEAPKSKRGRGRPKKEKSFDEEDDAEEESEEEEDEPKPAKGKKGKTDGPTLSDVNNACKELARRVNRAAAVSVLKKFGAKSVAELDEKKYPDVIKALKKAG